MHVTEWLLHDKAFSYPVLNHTVKLIYNITGDDEESVNKFYQSVGEVKR